MTDLVRASVTRVLFDLVSDEVRRQEAKWGEQNHPLRLGAYPTHLAGTKALSREFYAEMAAQWKAANNVRHANSVDSWDAILLEEVFEALAEDDASAAVDELIQVAAVAVSAAASVFFNGTGGR